MSFQSTNTELTERVTHMPKSDDRYHYTECGLDNIYLLNGFDFVETPRGRGAAIKDRDGLHRAIGRMLVREKKDLTGKQFRFLRHELNMTQQLLAGLLGVDTQTVARWEKEISEIPGPAQGLIRLLYEEHTNGNKAISEPLRKLAELDELIHGDDETMEFEDTDDGWQPAAMAA
jgi:putative transcriptional regulator